MFQSLGLPATFDYPGLPRILTDAVIEALILAAAIPRRADN